MRFKHLDITAFRNLSSVVAELGGGLNYFHGDNGAGKTALLEAVHLLCRGRSFRTQRVEGLIQHNAEALRVAAEGEDEFRGPVALSIQRNRRRKTELQVDGLPERRMSVVARLTPLQVMLPDIADLVFGSPAIRRQWLDWGTFHVKPDFLPVLRDYLRVLKQRNALLKEGADPNTLAPWTERFFGLAGAVSLDRQEYLAVLEPHFISALSRLAPELEISLTYSRGWGQETSLEKLLGENRAREVKYGATQWGPHRADVLLQQHGATASSVLSRGQAKMVASALQISQAAMLADIHQRATVFLIDDAGAELDQAHNLRLFELLSDVGGQILATTTQQPDASDSIARLVSTGSTSPVRVAVAERSGEVRSDPREAPAQIESMDVRVFHVEHGTVKGE